MVEAQHHLQQPHHARALGDDDHAARAQRRSRLLERFLVVGHGLALGRRQHLGRDAAGDDALQLLAAGDAAAVLEQELLQRVAVLDLVDAGPLDVAGDRHELRARALRQAELLERVGAVGDDAGDVGQRLDVVDDRRTLEEALDGEARRTVARIAALAFDGGEEPGRLAADVRAGAADHVDVAGEPGAEDFLAEEAVRVRLLDRRREAPVRQVEFAADVDERMPDLQRVRRDQHRLEQEVRRVLEDPAVLECPGLAFVGVRAEEVRLAVVELHHPPLAADRERGAAVAEQARRDDFLGDVRRRHRERLRQRLVAAARTVVGERMRRRGDRERHDELAAGHGYFNPSRSTSSFSMLMFS